LVPRASSIDFHFGTPIMLFGSVIREPAIIPTRGNHQFERGIELRSLQTKIDPRS
jgi:hypothetical protein